MKKGLIICTPDVAYGPLALLSGTFEQKAARAANCHVLVAGCFNQTIGFAQIGLNQREGLGAMLRAQPRQIVLRPAP